MAPVIYKATLFHGPPVVGRIGDAVGGYISAATSIWILFLPSHQLSGSNSVQFKPIYN